MIANDISNEHAVVVGLVDNLARIIGNENQSTSLDLTGVYRQAVRVLAISCRSERALVELVEFDNAVDNIVNALSYGTGKVANVVFSSEYEYALENSLSVLVQLLKS